MTTCYAWVAFRWAIPCACLGSLLGFALSQYHPLFGGILVQVSEPYSPTRLQLAPGHFLFGGIAGLACGAVLGFAFSSLGGPAEGKTNGSGDPQTGELHNNNRSHG